VDAALNLDEQITYSLLDELMRRGTPTVVYTSDDLAFLIACEGYARAVAYLLSHL
jgi:hypothetical protein